MKLFKNLILLLVAIILGVIFIPIGVVFAVVKLLLLSKPKKAYKVLTDLVFNIAVGIDQLGNTSCKYLFNATLIKGDTIEFGNVDETVSSVLGKNYLANNLTKVGKVLNYILNKIDPKHSIKSIGS
jgi:hypothetical protein